MSIFNTFLKPNKDGYVCAPVDNEMPHFLWDNQVVQYPEKGEPGFSYMQGPLEDGLLVDCLLYRDDDGNLVGVLNHFPFDAPQYDTDKGDIAIFVKPKMRNHGIGKLILAEGLKRFKFDLKKQIWTKSGTYLLYSFLKYLYIQKTY